jgi:hypothetical protein
VRVGVGGLNGGPGSSRRSHLRTPHTQTQRTHTHTRARPSISRVFLGRGESGSGARAGGGSRIFDLIERLESGVGRERGRERPRRLCSEHVESRAEMCLLFFRHKSASLKSWEVLFRRSRASPRVTETPRQRISTARHGRLAGGVSVRQRHNLERLRFCLKRVSSVAACGEGSLFLSLEKERSAHLERDRS